MSRVEDKQRGLIPPGLQSWQLQLIEHFSNTTSVVPPPAGPAGCRPLYLLHLLNLSFTLRAPNGAAYSNLGRTKVLHATSLVLLGVKAKFLRRKPKQIVSEYDQEIPQSQTADNPVAPRGRAPQPSRDTNEAKQSALSSPLR